MNETQKKLLHKIVLGFILGMLIGVIFWLTEGKKPYVFLGISGLWGTILCIAYCGIFGAVGLSGQMLYDIDRYSLARATITHLLIVLAGLFILGVCLGWNPNKAWVWILVAAYVATFFLIWLIMYCYYKAKVRKINKGLQKWKSAHEDSRPHHTSI